MNAVWFINCSFFNNNLTALMALLICSLYSSFSHKVVITNVSIHCHENVQLTSDKAISSAILVANMNVVWFTNCSFFNNLTALMALASQLTFHGNITSVNNQGVMGGAMALYESGMYLINNTLCSRTTKPVSEVEESLWQRRSQLEFHIPASSSF